MTRSEYLSEEINDNIEKSETSGVLITALEKGDVLKISTDGGDYKFTIIDPRKSRVLVEGQGFSKGGKEAVLAGSNWGGSMLKMHWVGPDTRVEVGGLVLPWTTGIMLNDKTVLSSKGVQ